MIITDIGRDQLGCYAAGELVGEHVRQVTRQTDVVGLKRTLRHMLRIDTLHFTVMHVLCRDSP